MLLAVPITSRLGTKKGLVLGLTLVYVASYLVGRTTGGEARWVVILAAAAVGG
eukprot:gene6543-28043_t